MKNFGFQRKCARRLLGALLVCLGAPATAATYVVTNASDAGTGTLRAGMLAATASPEDDTIQFEAELGVITLNSPLPDLLVSGGALTLNGNGAANTIIDGAGQHRPFKAEWQYGLQFTLRNLTVRNGFADQGQGGAIYILGGDEASRLTLDTVEFVGNRSTYDGGAIHTGILTTVDNSLFLDNYATTYGSAIVANGMALLARNSTIARNTAISGLDIWISGDGVAGPVSRLVNVTFTGNVAALEIRREARVSVSNSLIDGTIGQNGGQIDLSTSFNNFIRNADDSGFQDGINGNQVSDAEPLVGPIGHHGGPTRTIPLLPGSPLLDAGTSSAGDIPSQDQRGLSRIGAPDIGAFESRGFTLSQTSGNGQSTAVNTPFADPLVVTATAVSSVEPVAGGWMRFSAPTNGASAVFAVPTAIIGSDGTAPAGAIANGVVGGPYTVTASLSATESVAFSLTNVAGVCGAFTFPYTLSGADNTARVAELRQAIECANVNASDDEIDLRGNTLIFSDAPYSNANGPNALPIVTGALILSNGVLERDTSAPMFRFLEVVADEILAVQGMQLRHGSSDHEGGAIQADGLLTLQDCVFEDNRSAIRGGALSTHAATNIINTRFERNAAPDGAAIAGGDDDAIPGGDVTLVMNSRFHDNGDGSSRSVIWNKSYFGMLGGIVTGNRLTLSGSSLMFFHEDTAVAELRNVTIADNVVQGVLLSRANSDVQLRNSIVWDNEYATLGQISPIYSILPGVSAMDGNLNQPPGFVVTPGDYHLDAGSPAIDAGDNSYGGGGVDLDGNPRSVDDAGVVDTGFGNAPIIDIGAYEYQGTSAAAGITITPTSGLITTEAGGTASFTVVLDRYPSAAVTLPLSSSNPAEGMLTPNSLSFTRANWNQPQTVTVTGLDDGVIDGDQPYTIVTAQASSADPAYNGIDPPDVTVVNEEEAIPPRQLGGTVIGLLGQGLELTLDDGSDALPITANGNFVFNDPIEFGETYSVTVLTQPLSPAQACVVLNGEGTIGAVDISDVIVNCGASNTHSVGGMVSGLTGGGLTLQLNGSGDLSLSASGSYAFLPRLVDGAAYLVSVSTQPQGQLCTLANASGIIAGTDISDVNVSCAPLQANLQLSVDDGHAFSRYGHVRDYFVTLGNTGNTAANDVAIAATFSAAFDVPNVHWLCIGGGINCGASGSGGFSDVATVPANSSLTWIVSVPVLAASNEPDATLTIGHAAPAGIGFPSAADTNTLVIFRDGYDVPYADGTQALDEVERLTLPDEGSVSIEWPPGHGEGIRSVRVLETATGTLDVQGLTWAGAQFVRLLGTAASGQQHASDWASTAVGAQLVIGRMVTPGTTGIVLLEGASRPLALAQVASDNNGEIE